MRIVLFLSRNYWCGVFGSSRPGEPTIDEEKIKYSRKSGLADGVPFLKLAGSNYEIGLQFGVLMKNGCKQWQLPRIYVAFPARYAAWGRWLCYDWQQEPLVLP